MSKEIVEEHKISSLAAPFNLNGKGFKIYLMKKTANDADVLLVKGKLIGSDLEVTIPVNTNQISDQTFKEISTTGITLTGHDLYFCVESPTTFNVTFNTNGGIFKPTTQVKTYGELAVLPTPNPIKDNCYFKCWNLGESEYNFSTPITSDIELQANWKEYFDVVFDTKGGNEIAAQKVYDGGVATQPASPTKAGFVFDGWTVNGEAFTFDTPITASTGIVATWLESFQVTFNSDGGSAITTQNITDGEAATEPIDPTKEGYEFVEWQLNGVAYDFATLVTEDITLTATWLEVFTVTFDSQGGSEITAQEVTDGDLATLPDPAPTKDTFTFQHWSLTTDGTEFAFTTPITADTTLYAIWTLT